MCLVDDITNSTSIDSITIAKIHYILSLLLTLIRQVRY
jgi:hypothetical protein